MVGYLMLLKMLHCNHNLHRKRRNSDDVTFTTNKSLTKTDPPRAPRIKKERYDPEEQGTCRVCLKEGNIPIYGNETYEDISEALCTFGDITLSSDDDYTKFLCRSCHEFLVGAIEFRKKAKQSDETLRWPQSENFLDNDAADNIQDEVSSENEDNDEEEHNYFCRKCVRGFKTFKEYSEHRLSAEHENVRHKCPICNKLYTAVYIKKHMLLHKLERQFMCDICGKKFPLQAPFKRHRVTHFYSLPFQCTLCPYRGRFRESLKMHMRTHTGEKPYQCSQCPSRFVNASNLNKHMLTHTRNHDFKCDMCGRGFYTKRDLGSHFKVDHSGIKEHVCNMCGKAFGYRKQMMKHQLTVHKREKLRSGRTPLYLQVESQNKVCSD
ncbi:gastrula zinc finger protein XlCGF17.1-like [Maniola hyperantus]|uniref:gastrula zinc finger protein XlCGF17.1-like n=1 Tax=Aphantopus hyperantus TaxID=2795564 RepID=UPI001568E23B|nr:zinc finger protein 225-like [Maniola hyperantus]